MKHKASDLSEARDNLIEQAKRAAQDLKWKLEGRQRDYDKQRSLLARYQAYLKAADVLGGYDKVEDA